MKNIIRLAIRLICDDGGLETVEWGVTGAMIVTGVVVVGKTLGTQIVAKFTALQTLTS